MSLDYLEGREVFHSMKNLYNQLYSKEEKFRRAFSNRDAVTIKLDDEDDCIYYIEETGDSLCLEGYDLFLGVETAVSMKFTKIFEYDEKSAPIYSCGVIVEEDREYDGCNYSIVEPDCDYPLMDEVLVKKGKELDWKSSNRVPSVFGKLLNALYILEDDEDSVFDKDSVPLVRIYNENGDLLIDFLNPFYGVYSRVVYGEDSKIDALIEKVVCSVNGLKVPVNEVFVFNCKGISSCRLKKNNTGEYTLVVE